jgi:hypothetical protein
MGGKASERYKLFNDDVLRNVVFTRLTTQLAGSGACPKDATVRLCLAAGKVASKKDREELTSYFKLKDWGFYSDDWIRRELRRLASFGYENEISIVTTKILNREPT